jgi:hypothetical protein
MSDEELQQLVRFYKALADESRLRIVGILAGRECSVEELAAMLRLKEPTVSHHLAKLKELGLVRMRADGTTHLYRLGGDALRAMNRELLTPETVAVLVDDVEGTAWERKVLRDFFDGERLKEIPASRKKRQVVLTWLAMQFEPERPYPEAEVNAVLKRHHPDAATLRRELVGYHLLERAHGAYRRPLTPPDAQTMPASGTER